MTVAFGTVALGKHGKRWEDWEKAREKRFFHGCVLHDASQVF
jgi:hypothetical protein